MIANVRMTLHNVIPKCGNQYDYVKELVSEMFSDSADIDLKEISIETHRWAGTTIECHLNIRKKQKNNKVVKYRLPKNKGR